MPRWCNGPVHVNHYVEPLLRNATDLLNRPATVAAELEDRWTTRGMPTQHQATAEDLRRVAGFLREWKAVVDAPTDHDPVRVLNQLLARYTTHPSITIITTAAGGICTIATPMPDSPPRCPAPPVPPPLNISPNGVWIAFADARSPIAPTPSSTSADQGPRSTALTAAPTATPSVDTVRRQDPPRGAAPELLELRLPDDGMRCGGTRSARRRGSPPGR